jgi:DNA/RNA endonuclease YhcR with UshA esterase domain
MRGSLICSLLVWSSVTVSLAWSQAQMSAQKEADTPSHQSKATIEGLVRDIACPIQNLEATATHLSMKCLLACARKGSPLVILTKDGELYLPISNEMPDTDQRQKLMPFLGKYVQATGTVYERKGTHAIAINEIKELKDVHLTIEDQ